MLKREERNSPKSCWNKAQEDERLFVLLQRDKAAPETIRFWAAERIRRGQNTPDDPQILEALECARLMEQESK